jgi:branched-chain amino acid transport system permease protein
VTAGLLLQAVLSGLLLGGVYGLVASGLTLIFGVLRIINFAHGAVMMLGMYAAYWLYTLAGVDPYAGIVVIGPAFFGFGMLLQRLVIEPNRGAAEHNQLLLTLGLALFFENLALVLWQGDFRTVRVPYASEAYLVGEAVVELPRLIAFAGAVLMAVALYAFLRRTDVGKAIRALSEEPEGAMLMGVHVGRIRAVAFGIGAGCVAVAGALVTPFFYVAPDVGESFNIMAFVVVVLGGMGNFLGALVGGLIVGLAESLGAVVLPGSLKQLVVFLIFVLVLLFRPSGLFGSGSGPFGSRGGR